MAISVKEVQDGKGYITSGLQVRRVLSLEGKKVTYEARGKKPIPEDQFWGRKLLCQSRLLRPL